MSQSIDRLSKSITKKSSLQTYYTIKFLVDKNMVNDAYKAYSYFRWLDDRVDIYLTDFKKRKALIIRQKKIIDNAYGHKVQFKLIPDEKIIAELIAADVNPDSKLKSFIINFFKIIEFDAYRKGHLISQKELDWYSNTLGIAVTDCILHFIGHNTKYSDSKNQYLAAASAHIVHMLRDYFEDIKEGYINIPKEYLQKHKLKPDDTNNQYFKDWVKKRVLLARQNFKSGKTYIAKLPVLRSKIAAYLYCARFEWILNTIEKDNYILRHNYPKPNKFLQSINYLYSIILFSIK